MSVASFLNIFHLFQYVLTDEFYTDRSVWYRLWYILPVFVQFRMRMYIGMNLVVSNFIFSLASVMNWNYNIKTLFAFLKKIYFYSKEVAIIHFFALRTKLGKLKNDWKWWKSLFHFKAILQFSFFLLKLQGCIYVTKFIRMPKIKMLESLF